jgi:hypothetical protein
VGTLIRVGPPVISIPDGWHHAMSLELLAGSTADEPEKVDDT